MSVVPDSELLSRGLVVVIPKARSQTGGELEAFLDEVAGTVRGNVWIETKGLYRGHGQTAFLLAESVEGLAKIEKLKLSASPRSTASASIILERASDAPEAVKTLFSNSLPSMRSLRAINTVPGPTETYGRDAQASPPPQTQHLDDRSESSYAKRLLEDQIVSQLALLTKNMEANSLFPRLLPDLYSYRAVLEGLLGAEGVASQTLSQLVAVDNPNGTLETAKANTAHLIANEKRIRGRLNATDQDKR